jgi:hypothetical protein
MAVGQTQVGAELQLELQQGIVSSLAPLDAFVGEIECGAMTLLDSASPFVHDLAALYVVQAIQTLGGDVVYVDGGNTADPLRFVARARRIGLDPETALRKIHVARAFTAYQMTSLVRGMEERVAERGARMVVVASLVDLFLDPDMWWPEAYELLGQCVEILGDVTARYGTATIVTNYRLSKLLQKGGLQRFLYGASDRVVRFEPAPGALRVRLPHEDRSTLFHPVPPRQRTLEDFTEGW